MNGIERIAAERKRQIEVLGYTPEHDEEHCFGEIAGAGAAYADFAARQIGTGIAQGHPVVNTMRWPLPQFSDDPIRNLEKAGALIAAEIDRLLAERASAGKEDHDA